MATAKPNPAKDIKSRCTPAGSFSTERAGYAESETCMPKGFRITAGIA
jgi:hypothetical protein